MEHNIEKNKEIFEREMTEVLLNLKGRFSVVSRKDTLLAETAAVEIPEITPVTLPEINCDFQAISLPDTAVEASARQIDNITLAKMTVPAVPDRAVNLSRTGAEDISVEKPVLQSTGTGEIKVNSTLADVECSFTGLTLPDTEITASPRQIAALTVEKAEISAIPDRAVNLPRTGAEDISVEKPVLQSAGTGEIKVNSTLADVECSFTGLTLPDTEITASPRQIAALTVEKAEISAIPDRTVTLPLADALKADTAAPWRNILSIPDTGISNNEICITVPETVQPQIEIPDISVTVNTVLDSRQVVKPQLSLPDTETGIIFSKTEPLHMEKTRVEVTDAAFSPMKYIIPDDLITINKLDMELSSSFDWSAAEELRGIYGK